MLKPSPEVAAILNALLDIHERRELARRDDAARRQTVRVRVDGAIAAEYFSQVDPLPRQVANEQLQRLEREGLVKLDWVRGERGHLLAAVALQPERADAACAAIGRTPASAKRARLLDALLAERARYRLVADPADWRARALSVVIHQLRDGRAPAPFSLDHGAQNEDVLAALDAVGAVNEETPYRAFSVRAFNDSKRFEPLAPKLAALARRGNPAWRALTRDEVLRELNLVANPNHIFLAGAWALVDAGDRTLDLSAFNPAIGLPAAQAARVQQVRVGAPDVICIENLTSFYEWVRGGQASCAICLAGNPSPAIRHLLGRVPAGVPMWVWADLDYGGFNILAQVRSHVNANARALGMDVETFERHARFARPLAPGDAARLTRLLAHPRLEDARPTIAHLLARGLKLEQEAITPPAPPDPPPARA